MRFTKIRRTVVAAVAFAMLATLTMSAVPVRAAINNPAPAPKVSFTFDDGLASALTQAAPTLATYGLTGTNYVITHCVGMTTAPNTCAADTNAQYMTWAQVGQLRDTYGWEIGGHSVDHPQLATDNLTDAQLATEVAGSKQALAAQGFTANAFASPYGDYDNRVLAEIAKSYSSHRGFADVDNNVWSYNDILINNMQVQAGVTVAQVKSRIDEAIAQNYWLVLTFHDIKTNPSTNPEDYQYKTSNLDLIAAYVKTKQDAGLIKNVNMTNGLVSSDTNLFSNSGFDSGISGGWTTDTPANVVADSNNNGSFPGAQKSVAMTALGSGNAHLFSPKVTVDNTKTYMLKNFVNIKNRTSGEFGYYIDEYNSSGSWISGKWIKGITKTTVESSNFTYVPSSAAVKKASLQIYVTGGSGITAHVDNFQFFPLEADDTTPPPPPADTNLLPNSTFDSGIAEGWTTNNSSAFAADSGSHGSTENPVNSVKITAGSGNASLFAPLVSVSNATTYNISAYLNLLTRNNEEIAVYIDEYGTSTNWISGQYRYAKRTTGAETITFDYTPTSSAVKKAGLQFIVVGGSGITGYLDHVVFAAPGGTPTTPPTPVPSNIVANGTFDAGIADGWSTNDPANITADSSSHGSTNNAVYSVKLVAGAQNRHLFSGQVGVSNSQSYTLSSYLNIEQLTSGEVGFYIDEYNAAGDWISGQYKAGVNVLGSSDVTFSYVPSSSNVAKASLQVIVVGNSGLRAYFDDVRWFQN